MFRDLAAVNLKTGEPVSILVVESPDHERSGQLLPFLSHKGGIWQWHMQQALRAPLDDLRTRFYLARLEGEIVGNICTFEAPAVGILGHVFTRPDLRRKGICEAIMTELARDLQRRGVRFLTLGTGFDSAPFHIYSRFGFRGVEPGSGMMRWDLDSQYMADVTAPGPSSARPLRWDDWPRLNALMLASEFPRLRSVAYGVTGFTNMESVGLKILRARQEDTTLGAWILENGAGSLVGLTTLAPNLAWQNLSGWDAGWLLDIFVLPSFSDAAAEMLRRIELPPGRVTCILEQGQAGIGTALAQCGFQRACLIPGWLRSRKPGVREEIDAEVWRR